MLNRAGGWIMDGLLIVIAVVVVVLAMAGVVLYYWQLARLQRGVEHLNR